MIEFLNSIQNSLIYKNFFLVLSGLDNTILLLLISNNELNFLNYGSPEIRTQDQPVKSRMLYR